MPIPKKEFTCTKENCKEKFCAPDWEAKDGHRHVVEPKTYYATAGSLLTYASSERLVKLESGESHLVMPIRCQFNRGTYATTDPETQNGLDNNAVLVDMETWERYFRTPEDQLTRKNQKLQAENTRLIQEQNDLLNEQKKLRGGKGAREGAVA